MSNKTKIIFIFLLGILLSVGAVYVFKVYFIANTSIQSDFPMDDPASENETEQTVCNASATKILAENNCSKKEDLLLLSTEKCLGFVVEGIIFNDLYILTGDCFRKSSLYEEARRVYNKGLELPNWKQIGPLETDGHDELKARLDSLGRANNLCFRYMEEFKISVNKFVDSRSLKELRSYVAPDFASSLGFHRFDDSFSDYEKLISDSAPKSSLKVGVASDNQQFKDCVQIDGWVGTPYPRYFFCAKDNNNCIQWDRVAVE